MTSSPTGLRAFWRDLPREGRLLLSIVVATLSLGNGRTTIMQGMVHVVIFAVYLFITIVP